LNWCEWFFSVGIVSGKIYWNLNFSTRTTCVETNSKM
jgi:hypothetical protein